MAQNYLIFSLFISVILSKRKRTENELLERERGVQGKEYNFDIFN